MLDRQLRLATKKLVEDTLPHPGPATAAEVGMKGGHVEV
jgi:hypothetical protein